MKTTFTIEIKDGRGQASTGRVLLPTGNQRAGRLLTAGVECLHPQLLVLHVRQVLWLVSSMRLTMTGTAYTPPTASLPPPELTLGLRAPPTLLSTSSGGKNTITHINNPGTVTRLGSVTQVTTFSHASPGNRGGCNFKVSLSTIHQPHRSPSPVTAYRCRQAFPTVYTKKLRPERLIVHPQLVTWLRLI